MRTNFNNFVEQVGYMSHFIKNSTALERKCQICGKDADVKYSKVNSYEIQILCQSCKDSHKNMIDRRSNLYKDIPTIDVRDYIKYNKHTSPIVLDDYREKLRIILESNMTKKEILDYLDLTSTRYNKLIEACKDDSEFYFIEDDLKAVRERGRLDSARKSRTSRKLVSGNNNINKIKLERNLSNKDIIDLCDRKITTGTLCLISEGKSKATVESKLILMDGLGVSLHELFPEYKKTSIDFKNSADYMNILESVKRDLLYTRKFYQEIAKLTRTNYNILHRLRYEDDYKPSFECLTRLYYFMNS